MNPAPAQKSDTAGRFSTVAAKHTPPVAGQSYAFKYIYETGSRRLIDKIEGRIHTHDNTWEPHRDVLVSKTATKNSDGVVYSGHSYLVNSLGQRTSHTAANTGFGSQGSPVPNTTAYAYNAAGELVSADASHGGSTYDRHFAYDAIGNRTGSRTGTATSTGGTPTTYTANSLNQYTAIGSLNPAYDADGNMTSGPLPAAPAANATLVWDAENRLVAVTRADNTVVYFAYDAQGRRISKQTGNGAMSAYVYDGWNMAGEYSITNGTTTLVMSFTWGLDLSGTLQGAGGVGGLLAVRRHTGPGVGTYYPAYDGNGNITEYLNSSNYGLRLTYDAFGNTIAKAGSFSSQPAASLPFRFSTKYLDGETGLYYYGYRYYDPFTGRWPSRDPIGEKGHELVRSVALNAGLIVGRNGYVTPGNLYNFVWNDPISLVDSNGEFIFATIVAVVTVVAVAVTVEKIVDATNKLEEAMDKGRKAAELMDDPDTLEEGNAMRQDAVDEWREGSMDLIENVPNTSITGPATGPAKPINPTDPFDVIGSAADTISKLKKIKCACSQKSFATKFKGFKEAMESAGYKWVPNPTQGTNIPGGHFRRPNPNPNHLPHPRDVNRRLRELFEDVCEE